MEPRGQMVDRQRAHQGRQRPDTHARPISIDKVRDAVAVRARSGLEARGLGNGSRIVSLREHAQSPPANFAVDRLVIVTQPHEITFPPPAKTVECLLQPVPHRVPRKSRCQSPRVRDRPGSIVRDIRAGKGVGFSVSPSG
jgi:hypothetical protein